MFFSSTAAAAQQQWWRRRLVAVFGPSTPGQTRTPNKENGTPERDFFSGLICILCIVDRAPHRGSWNRRSSSGGSDVAATDEKDERGCAGEPFIFVLALSRNLKRTSADTPRSL